MTMYGAHGERIAVTIDEAISRPVGIAVDGYGRLYVANNDDTVTTFAGGKRTPLTIRTALSAPRGVAISNAGRTTSRMRATAP